MSENHVAEYPKWVTPHESMLGDKLKAWAHVDTNRDGTVSVMVYNAEEEKKATSAHVNMPIDGKTATASPPATPYPGTTPKPSHDAATKTPADTSTAKGSAATSVSPKLEAHNKLA